MYSNFWIFCCTNCIISFSNKLVVSLTFLFWSVFQKGITHSFHQNAFPFFCGQPWNIDKNIRIFLELEVGYRYSRQRNKLILYSKHIETETIMIHWNDFWCISNELPLKTLFFNLFYRIMLYTKNEYFLYLVNIFLYIQKRQVNLQTFFTS